MNRSKVINFKRLRMYFWLLKYPVLAKRLGTNPTLAILEGARGNTEVIIQLALADLLICKNHIQAFKLLGLLASLPDNELESNSSLKSHFKLLSDANVVSVRAIHMCQNVIQTCFSAK